MLQLDVYVVTFCLDTMLNEVRLHVCLPQGPLRNTCGHFWLMIWEQRTKAIIMLNRVIEKGAVS